jgi:hypothetical protein
MVVEANGTEWLFGAPEGVGTALKEADLGTPQIVFTTKLRAPGIHSIDGPVVRFKNEPLTKDGLQATPITRKHGHDYMIEANGTRVLFSERGDVGTADLEEAGADLAVIKNKNRADAWGSEVITWPWPDAEYDLAFKVYSSLEDAPANLKKMDGVALSLEQINSIVRQAEGIPEGEVDNPWAVAKGNFKKTHVVKDGAWVKRKKKVEKTEAGVTVSHEVSRSTAKENTTVDPVLKALGDLIEDIPGVPNDIPEGVVWSTVFKDATSDQWCWAGITSTAAWDLQEEYVSEGAMDWAIKFASVVGPGPLRYRHIPGLDGGVCTKQVRVGGFLFERGTFDGTPIGQAMKELMSSDPRWKLSPGLAFGANDLTDGVYKRMLIFERSMTQRPANPITSILAHDVGGVTMSVKQLTEQQLKDAAAELDLELEYVTTLHGQALAGGGIKSLEDFKTTLKEEAEKAKGKGKPFGGKKAKPFKKADEEEDEEAEEDEAETKAKELVAGLDADQRTVLKEMLEEADEADRDPVDELRTEVNAQMKEIREGQEATALALAKMAEAMTSTGTKEDSAGGADEGNLRRIVEEIMSMSPRRQAAQFASKEAGTGDGGEELSSADAAILAKLKEIETQVKQGQQPFHAGGGVYDAFTSTRLNPTQ